MSSQPGSERHVTMSGYPTSATEDIVAGRMLDLNVERTDDVVMVHVSGEIDMLTTPLLSSCLIEQLQTELNLLILDMRNVHFLGSSGLAALVTAREKAAGENVTLRLVSADHAVLRPLTAAGLAELFDIYPDLDAALTADRRAPIVD